MWEWLGPVLKTALGNVTVESVADWGTCFATAAVSYDLYTNLLMSMCAASSEKVPNVLSPSFFWYDTDFSKKYKI